ncbi:ATP-dependent helicase [Patescibacteria group bacterium]|nr:ATP-dependent helicase [Patescibacteria group bacterium]MBP9710361.1 ATP-dependent helicase [Patescibacteria group bacterium]
MSVFILQNQNENHHRRIDYAKELNQEQLDVVLGGDGPCLVLAGAGSGKTRTLTYRVAYLLEHGLDPSSILLLTFTNKAAREMRGRVESLLGTDARGIWGGTFHSIANRILRAFAEVIGYTSSFSILDQEDARDLVKAILKDLKIDPKARRFPSAAVVQDVISYARNVQQSIDTVIGWKHPNFTPFIPDIESIAAQYQLRKKSANAMDFDDLLACMAALLEDPIHGPNISGPFKYVLVDEFQDTNAIQARIVAGFAKAHRNILVVGDDAQSIYAFRGADVKNILSFPNQWPETKIFKLLTNYRSTPQILEVANASLSHNTEQFQKDLIAVQPKGDKPKLIPCASAAQEAQYVAEQILALRHEGTALRNMAVLFRSSAHSQALEFELMRRDIPYEYRGGQKFFERAHIKDIVCFLRIAHNPQDEVAWMRVLGLQTGIGDASASAIASQAKAATDFARVLLPETALLVPKRAQEGWREFQAIARDMLATGKTPATMIRAVTGSTYRDYLEREYPNWRERLEDLEQLALFAENYQEAGPFLNDIALYDDVVAGREAKSASLQDEERMVLSTIHQSKGLEWDTVFILHLAEGSFPSRRALAEDGMEEERRLFYVAVTRARKHLFLTYPMTTGYDTLMFNQPSTFVEEVPPRLFERVELREAGGYHTATVRRGGSSGIATGEWSDHGDDSPWTDEPTIQIDNTGERRNPSTKTIWKSATDTPPKKASGSFLRDVDEL